jgi:MraZ protein
MASFKGQAEYSVDSKGRVAIPARMRSALNPEAKNSFTITRGFEQCINLYPLNEWEKREAEISSLNSYRPETRDFVRAIMMWAEEVTLDGQGRIVIPKPLMEFARISDVVLIIGAFDHVEIWDPKLFSSYQSGIAEDYPTLAEKVLGGSGNANG